MGVSAAGAYGQSQANKASANAQAQVAENNATLAEYQARDAERRGSIAAQNVGYRTNQLAGSQRTAMAANGVDLGYGSALEILSDTEYFGQVDRATTVDNAAREAWGYRTQGANYSADASLLRGRADAESPFLAAGTSLLTSAGKVSSTWFKQSGPISQGDGLSQGDRRKIGVY